MSKLRRGGYVLVTWVGDHEPFHVHVYRDARLIVKWDLEHDRPMKGHANRKVLRIIDDLRKEGRL